MGSSPIFLFIKKGGYYDKERDVREAEKEKIIDEYIERYKGQ